jgi:hypothetical protein
MHACELESPTEWSLHGEYCADESVKYLFTNYVSPVTLKHVPELRSDSLCAFLTGGGRAHGCKAGGEGQII